MRRLSRWEKLVEQRVIECFNSPPLSPLLSQPPLFTLPESTDPLIAIFLKYYDPFTQKLECVRVALLYIIFSFLILLSFLDSPERLLSVPPANSHPLYLTLLPAKIYRPTPHFVSTRQVFGWYRWGLHCILITLFCLSLGGETNHGWTFSVSFKNFFGCWTWWRRHYLLPKGHDAKRVRFHYFSWDHLD